MVNKNDSKKSIKEAINNNPSIEEQFKKKSLHQHILDLPDTYIGSVQNDLMNIYVYNENENKIIKKDKYITLGLYKIFDEILVNASDNTVRDIKCNKIMVDINQESGQISVWNNGPSIPIEIHKEYDIYVPELIFGNLLTSGNYDQKGKIVGGKNGLGSKCIGLDVLVPLYDGTIKKAKDIKINDKLIGDDGKLRNIINIIRGNSQMYEITQSFGEKYTVNDNHTLSLHMPDHKVIFWNNNENGWSVFWWNNDKKKINQKTIHVSNKQNESVEYDVDLSENNQCVYNYINKDNKLCKKEMEQITKARLELEKFCDSINDSNVFDINIQDYLKLDEITQKKLQGYRGQCVQWEKKKVLLDPYQLGLWLGNNVLDPVENSSINSTSIPTNNDIEQIKYLSEFEKSKDRKRKNSYYISSTENFKKNCTPFKKLLSLYNLINNKHIPKDYLINDKETRLKVLAGIIDADKSLTNKSISQTGTIIVINQEIVHEQLVKDIVYLARSLGLNCSNPIKYSNLASSKNSNYENKDYTYKIIISGQGIESIPTLFPNKKYSSHRSINTCKTTGTINIKSIGNGEYVGIEIDSNRRFLINDFTVTHNCANIYSTRFDIEICDSQRKKKYFQRFTNNMYDKEEPIISSVDKNAESYIKITFVPDFKRFGLKNLTDDMTGLMKRRVYDIAGTTNENVNVWLNGKHLDIKSFRDYISMYYDTDEIPNLIYEEFNERWTIGVIYDPNAGFQHMSFVNKISTFKGGTHLDYISRQIVEKVSDHILSQSKYKTLKIKPHQIKENLTIFINSVIEDPSFSSQAKEELTTKTSLFNIKCELDDRFIGKICKTGLINELVQMAQIKQMGELEKSDGKKTTNLKSLTKLDDARLAGSKRSSECRLILTEGDSAKTFAISGLEIIGRDLYGVFPLKGKLLNVRDATPNQLLSNEEIKNLKQILGLKQNTVYTDTKKLRYGGVVVLTDQDSVSGDTPMLLKNSNNEFEIRTIDNISSNWNTNDFGKDITYTNFDVWTEKGWTKILKVIRHKVNKRIYRVLTHTGVVDVTEDHSLLNNDGTEISPKECKLDQELLHSFPKFYENKTELAELDDIDENEAYVMGLFFTNGTSNINNCGYKTEYSWNLSNINLKYLNKSLNIMRNLYDYDFKIIEDKDIDLKLSYKLIIINDNKLTESIINKYRNLFYDKYSKKYIPKEILNASYNVRKNFLDGYLDSQKYYNDDSDNIKCPNVPIKSFNIEGKISTHGIYFLFKSLGYKVSINTSESNLQIYTLTITKEIQQYNPHTIKKIIDLGQIEQYVYDLETDNHHFQAGPGEMIVHNTDGTHIKGLLINFFHYFWPDLLKIEGFIQSIATPIVKVYKNSDTKKHNPEIFYTLSEYKKWCEKQGDDLNKKFKIKYFKGLGTSTSIEAKESFNDFEKKIINYVWNIGTTDKLKLINVGKSEPYNNLEDIDNSDNISSQSSKQTTKSNKNLNDNISVCSENIDKNEPSYQAITLAFSKNRANDRKEWVKQRDENLIIENNIKKIPVYDFINKDLIHFSHEDNLRSIPDLVDGLKPSQRKILYGAFKRKLDNDEIKVAQLSGYISEHTGYHHGEASLQGAIINMAQNYCGSNNINLLYPSGNFGTRRLGGKDAASPRYIFTQLSSLTRNIFISNDEFVLENVIEEGDIVEPVRYYPIIPMILVNGSEGIGTGYSTNIPPFNPLDIIINIKAYIGGTPIDKLIELKPWYSGFEGQIEKNIDKKNQLKYISYGKYEQIDEYTLKITELPIGTWTQTYIDYLSKLIEEGIMLSDYENNCGNHKIDFKLYFRNGELQKLLKTNSIEEKLKLTSSIQVSNMHLYKNNEIVKYSNPNNIIKDYADIRLEIYKKRKNYLIKVLENELDLLKYRRKFIKEVISNKLIISKKQKQVLIQELEEKEYPELSTNINLKPSYDYLVGMSMWTLTLEKIDELESNYNLKKQELDNYKNKTIESLWLEELDTLENSYKKWFEDKINILYEGTNDKKKKKSNTNKSVLNEKKNKSTVYKVK